MRPAEPSEPLQQQLVAASRRLVTEGLTRGTSGNVSVRVPDREVFWITASGAALGELTDRDLVEVGFDGVFTHGAKPSSEWRIHRDVYAARPEVQAVVHAHPPFATTVACLRRALPAVHYEIAFAGGHDVRCADYATFGTEALSRAVLTALDGRKACLLANHGMLAVGASLDAAAHLARVVETVAELYWRALAVGEPVILDDAEMARVLGDLASYGPNAR